METRDNSYDIRKAFERIETELLQSMVRNMAGHRNWELDEGFKWSQWQAEQLRTLSEYKRKNKELFGSEFKQINAEIESAIRAAYKLGEMEQEIEILRLIEKGWKPPRTQELGMAQEFFHLNEPKLEALINAVKNDMEAAEEAVLRTTDDRYRKGIYDAQVYANSGAGTLWSAVDMAVADFLAQGINCIRYRNGNLVNIASYAEMAVRTANKRAYLYGEGSKRAEWGLSLVLVHSRNVACPNCLEWVGKVYVDDVWSGGTPDGKHPLISTAIAGGLYHPNCKDIHSTYYEGITERPKPMTKAQAAEAERVYDLQQEQRYNERQIRRHKRVAEAAADPATRQAAQSKVEAWQAKQRAFIDKNSDVLRRDYERERLRVFGKPNTIKKDKGGIYLSEPLVPFNKDAPKNDYSINRKVVNAQPYKDAFDKLPYSKNVRESAYKESGRILRDVDGTDYERLVAINARTGKLVADTFDYEPTSKSVRFNDEDFEKVKNVEDGVILIHNHPSGFRPSVEDLFVAAEYNFVKGIIASGNDGSLYYAEANSTAFMKEYEEEFGRMLVVTRDKFDAHLLARKYTDKLNEEEKWYRETKLH